ncbi:MULTISPECIES: AMP-binding protein [unclassified Saccharopolyspora]|uniref:AMP-binding protein n=1 Tax=unclassified Saccharopolyspora TaxID=2646250 RepID=UPI001CD43B95|nr:MULTISPECIES: AMP-binding protein [unclassified Saccharopolyspora]MCA1187999.1 AMP-binding protein [Saccharopolyspora sp. 6T]MCA1283099.1 AMP-binding protein [Saccharopolyspora sp. 7B]
MWRRPAGRTRGEAAKAAVQAGADRLAPTLQTLWLLIRQGVVRPMRPDKLLRIVFAWRRWGVTPALGYAVAAIRHPDRPAVIDERGALSFLELEQRTTRLARGLRARGIRDTSRVAVLCRNHHGLVETIVACGKIGSDVVLLNTGLRPHQMRTVLDEQRADLLIADVEFVEALPDLELDVVLAWTEGTTRKATLEHLIGSSATGTLPRRPRHARVIVLTSGTTGTPKGARRPAPPGVGPAATIMSRMPLRAGERIMLAAPIFHTWGLAAFQLGSAIGATLVLRRKFEPQQALAAVQRHRATALFVVPVMLQRILDLPREAIEPYDTSSLRIVAASGSALPADLATRFQRVFGEVLYNFYGSTEASWVSIATPRELAEAPGTAGRPPRGTSVKILDERGAKVPDGETGRIFVRNDMLFEGYTGGGGKEVRDGMLATGDLGRIDEAGRLQVVGREDDMIVSGGENVYPKETEDAIATLPEVSEVAVIGVDDAEFGQRLAAYVVLVDGAELDAEAVRERVRPALPGFALPRDVVFLPELPRNATGKVVPARLREGSADTER